MRTRYQVREPHAAHFITSSIVEWLPVFTSARCCDLLLESFAYCRAHKGLLIHSECAPRVRGTGGPHDPRRASVASVCAWRIAASASAGRPSFSKMLPSMR